VPLASGWRQAPGPSTVDSLVLELRTLGVRAGGTLLVHASLGALGWVCGGATAVVTALLEVLGPDGTLVVPTFTSDNRDPGAWQDLPVPQAWWPAVRAGMLPFDPAVTPSQGMGAIAEQVRTRPGALRSAHPQTSFAALGAHAARVTAGHDPSCHLGERSPLARLEELDAQVLLLGVGFERCTAFHLAEYRLPGARTRRYACVVRDEAPAWSSRSRGWWWEFSDVDLSDKDFARLGEVFERDVGLVPGQVGLGEARHFPLPPAVAFAETWLRCHRM
jgi:aminoglycoside 3-N-acetyltransferase